MYSTSFRHSASVVQKPSGVAVRLLSHAPARVKIGKADSFGGVEIRGLQPKENVSQKTKGSTGMSERTSAATLDSTDAMGNTRSFARNLDRYKAGQSPATFHPKRNRTIQPGLSWLGDDEFESAGLAFRLARRHTERLAVSKPTGGLGFGQNANSNAGPGSGPRGNDRRQRTPAGVSGNAVKGASQPKKGLVQKSRPKQMDATKTRVPRTVSSPTLKPSPAPLHINLNSTDFTSLFGASPSLSTSPSSPRTGTTPIDDASSRVQLALEQHGGDYSKLVSSSLVTSEGSPTVYAESTMARRRDLGPEKRSTALEIIRGMVDKTQGPQPTA